MSSGSDADEKDAHSEDIEHNDSYPTDAGDNVPNGASVHAEALSDDGQEVDEENDGESEEVASGVDEGGEDMHTNAEQVHNEEDYDGEEYGEEYDEEDDEEPALKYERLGGSIHDLLQKDSASALTYSRQHLVRSVGRL